jgi:hypothetical protein
MAGLDPAIPLRKARPCHIIGIAGSSPAMTALDLHLIRTRFGHALQAHRTSVAGGEAESRSWSQIFEACILLPAGPAMLQSLATKQGRST